MLPGRGFRNDDVSTLLSIESWISIQEMAALYQEAKEMEQRMLEYKSLDKATQRHTENKEERVVWKGTISRRK